MGAQFIKTMKVEDSLCSVTPEGWISLCLIQGSLNKIISVHLLDDNIPEEKEVYQVILYDVRTQGNADLLSFSGMLFSEKIIVAIYI